MIDLNETLRALPPEDKADWKSLNRAAFLSSGLSIIVLDDDATGTQTMFDVPVLTGRGEKEILRELENHTALFFILTNSRSLPAAEADSLAAETGKNIKSASGKAGRSILVISRGDSTLRGHYPNEVDALAAGLGHDRAPQIIIPAFFQGGRLTINDIHYVSDGELLVPVAETEFARDASFAYRSSDLKHYVEEKTRGSIKAEEVVSISIGDIRVGGPERISGILSALSERQVCIVNAAAQSDLDVFAAGFYLSQKRNGPILFRTAASILPSLAGLDVKAPLLPDELDMKGRGGVIAVGSYVPNTTGQLDYLRENFKAEYLEIRVQDLIHPDRFNKEVLRVAERINTSLEGGRVAVVFTSREVIKGSTAEKSLEIVNRISKGVVESMKAIQFRPGFFIAKGGITSSDIVKRAFQVKRAMVMGQIIPGVPAWRLDGCRRFPGLLYIPFPGNLGGKDAVYRAVKKLTQV